MLIPSIFKESLVDDWMDFPFEKEVFGNKNPLYGNHAKNMMKTDIREVDNAYHVDIDLPGFKKEEISAHLENGYLTISASKEIEKEEQKEDGKYLRKERYSGSMSRSFYLGDAVKLEDICAKYADGILKLTLPKVTQSEIDNKTSIRIEG